MSDYQTSTICSSFLVKANSKKKNQKYRHRILTRKKNKKSKIHIISVSSASILDQQHYFHITASIMH